ncbi:MAG: endonuclease III [Gemmatimonadota bacterium]|nr:endonuclease III [Gemmatimonadota bacterium]
MTAAGPDAGRVREILESRYGDVGKPRLAPLDELVLTILSQSTTDANRDRAFDRLRARYADWDDVRTAARSEIEETVRVAGLAGQKAGAIQGALERLHDERGTADLDHLHEMDDEEAVAYLTSFTGVGVKTAACVLCFSLRRPVLPVDTHVLRIARRLAWIPPRCTATRAHTLVQARVEPNDRFALHMLMIAHGRATCTARSPDCDGCPLRTDCPRVGV